MGPKKGKEGKKKKSKQEIEEEKKQKEQEEYEMMKQETKRMEEERKELERLAREKKEREFQDRIDELRALTKELEDTELEVDERAYNLAAIDKLAGTKASWAKYVECNPRPDASSEAALNTYLSLLEDEKPTALDDALASCEYTESIANELCAVLANAEAKGQPDEVRHCSAFLQRLRDASCSKLDVATAHILQHADEFMDDEKKEVLVTGQRAGVRLGIWVNLVLKQIRGPMRPLDFSEVGLRVDIPRALNTQMNIGARIVFYPHNHISQQYLTGGAKKAGLGGGDDDSGALGAGAGAAVAEPPPEKDLVLGGTMYLELVALPPPPKRVKPQWVLRPVTELSEQVELLPYPLTGEHTAVVAPPPLRCTISVPPGVIVPADNPRVAWWDEKARAWSDEPLSEVEYMAETRQVRFLTIKVGVLALVQDRGLDLPYKAWRLEPALPTGCTASEDEEPCVRLTLETTRMTVVIQVRHLAPKEVKAREKSGASVAQSTLCKLLQPKVPELEAVMAEEMPPGPLMAALARAGLNLTPRDTDVAARHAIKTKALEEKLADELASVCASFDFAASRFSPTLAPEHCAVLVRETSVYVGVNDETLDYATAMIEHDDKSKSAIAAPGLGEIAAPGIKCTLIAAKEASYDSGEFEKKLAPDGQRVPKLNKDPLKGHASHIYLVNCVKPMASDEAMARVKAAPLEFCSTVKQLLRLTRPFSFGGRVDPTVPAPAAAGAEGE